MELSGHVSKYSNSNHNTSTITTTCSSSSCMMSFGDNNTTSGAAMAMIMPFMSTHPHSHHHPHHNPNNHSPLFLPLPPPPLPNNSNNNNNSPGSGSGSSMIIEDHRNNNIAGNCFFMEAPGNNNNGNGSSTSAAGVRAKIMAHPLYHRLLAAYVSCQKVGAPPEVVGRLEEACTAAAASMGSSGLGCIGEDPALDQFMEAYCEMLTKYEQELSKPFKEAMVFLQRVESQFKAISLSSPTSAAAACGGDGVDWNALSDEEGDMNSNPIDPLAEDRELKCQLLRKYSGYLGSLKQEFLKKRKKGKLPKEARQQLLDWWTRHYKWPYPSESQKIALAEATGLDQKQINNWFINQRKRHWKPSEDMQFVVMDATHPHYYMDNVLGNPYPMDLSPTML